MKKVTTLVLMLCFILFGAHCFASNEAKTEDKGDGIIIDLLEVSSSSGPSRSNSIQVTLDGHALSVVFLENLGQVAVELTTASGGSTQYAEIHTPNGINFYIPNNGSYIITFTLENGDQYYGEFEVTD